MVKQSGVEMIELTIIIATISILATLIIPFFEDETYEDDVFEEVLDAPMEHIRNDLRLNDDSITLIRHTDGTVWGCLKDSKNCYMVSE